MVDRNVDRNNNTSGEERGPGYKDQFREAQPPLPSRESPHHTAAANGGGPFFKNQAHSRANPNNVGGNATTDPTEPPTTSHQNNTSDVLTVSKSTLARWVLGIIILTGAVIGGFCISGKCRSNSGRGGGTQLVEREVGDATPSLRPVPLPPPVPTTPSASAPIATAGPPATAAPVQAPVVATPPTSPTATPCTSATDCRSGVPCARESLEVRTLVCCPSGAAETVYSPMIDTVCTGQPAGAACTSDSPSLCASAVCFQNACLAGPQPAGSMCDSNDDCISTCIQGTCTDGLQPTGAACDDDSDCLNSVCALETAAKSSSVKQVCCPTGDSEYFIDTDVAKICTGQLTGATCGSSDTICQSGTCFQGKCQEDLQPSGGACDNNEDCTGTCIAGICTDVLQPIGAACDDDGDCLNSACALETAAKSSSVKQVCCPTGDSEYFIDTDVAKICTGQLAGATCGSSDTICHSGTCFQGQCQEALQVNGRPCDTNEDCTGTCVGGVCKSASQPAGAACDDNTDCANDVCALKTASSTSAVCCPSGQSKFDVTVASGVGYICIA
jgi:hypothetical protein